MVYYLKIIINAPLNEIKTAFQEFKNFLADTKENVKGEHLMGLDELQIWVNSKST